MNGVGNTDINSHYEQWDEKSRLFNGTGVLEYVRSQELIERYLPPSPATILDVGGGPGVSSGRSRSEACSASRGSCSGKL